ncbi:hypothetical protein ACFL54_02540 [Planctomycetota bacterium]
MHKNPYCLRMLLILGVSLLFGVIILSVPPAANAGDDNMAFDFPEVTCETLPRLMKNPDPFYRAVAVYLCKPDNNQNTIRCFILFFIQEKDLTVKSMLADKIRHYSPASLLPYFDEAVILQFVETLGPPTTICSPTSYALLSKVLAGKWPRTKKKFLRRWDKFKEGYLHRQQEARGKNDVKPIKVEENGGNHNPGGTVAEDDPKAKIPLTDAQKIPDVLVQTEDGVDFAFAMDSSNSNKDHFYILRKELNFLIELAIFLNEENRVGCLAYCKNIEGFVPLTNNGKKAKKDAGRLKHSTHGVEMHDVAINWALDNLEWINDKKIFLLITDEPFFSKGDEKSLWTKLFFKVADGFTFHLLIPTNLHNVEKLPDMGFEDYLKHGKGSKTIYKTGQQDFIVTLAKFFVRKNCRKAMEPFLAKMLEILRQRNQMDK